MRPSDLEKRRKLEDPVAGREAGWKRSGFRKADGENVITSRRLPPQVTEESTRSHSFEWRSDEETCDSLVK